MGKLESLVVLLNNRSKVYSGGQKMSGSVKIILNEPMNVRGVRIELKGEAYVHWSESQTTGSGKTSQTITISYSARETYFNYSVVLCGSGPSFGANQISLTSGEHQYPFEFHLPYNIPSSYEGRIGHVRYYVKTVMDKPWKFDHTCKIPFTVIAVQDLNNNLAASQQCQQQGTKHFCCLCCKSGALSANFVLPRTGYVPGEDILINAEISNMSDRKVDSKVSLDMVTHFHATTKTKHVRKNITTLKRGDVLPGDTDYWNQIGLRVPPLPDSGLIHCKIIDIDYILTLSVSASFAISLKLPIKVIIGTIPLRTWLPTVYSMPQPLSYQSPNVAPSAPPDTVRLIASEQLPGTSQTDYGRTGNNSASSFPPPPPTYEECVFGKVNIAADGDNSYTRGQLNFAPTYPCYNFQSAQKYHQVDSPTPTISSSINASTLIYENSWNKPNMLGDVCVDT